MDSFFSQVFNLLTAPPGNMAYYVILAFTVVGALQSSIYHWRQTGFPQGNRMVAGLTLLLILQLAQFAVAGLVWQGLLKPERWLPPVDRLVILVSLILIVWLWLVPEPRGRADMAFGLLVALAVTLFGVSLVWRNSQPFDVNYNAVWPGWVGNWFAMFITLMGMLGLLMRRPNSWGIGLAMLFLLFVGPLFHFLLPQDISDYSGPIRLAQLMAFPWLLALPQRFPIPASSGVDHSPVKAPTVAERRRYNTDPKVIQEFIGLISLTDASQLCREVSRIISQMMLADFCLLASPPASDGSMTVACGYNLIEEKSIEGYSIDGRLAPMISSAFRRNKPLRLPASSTSTDLQALSQGLHLTRVGHLLAVPIAQPGQPPIMDLILLLPFSKRGWSPEDQEVLLSLTHFLALVFRSGQTGSASSDDIQQLRRALDAVQESKQELLDQLEKSQDQVIRERQRTESLSALINAQDKTVIVLPELQSAPSTPLEAGYDVENGDAVEQPDQVSRQAFEELQADLRLALEQVADMRADLAQAEKRQALAAFSTSSETIVSGTGQPAFSKTAPGTENLLAEAPAPTLWTASAEGKSSGGGEDVASIVQDMRQPLSSMLGYADLLLGESIGILGALQRKFLERIRASAERMGGMTDDLILLTTMEETHLKLKPQLVHINQLINDAVSTVRDEIIKKDINLLLDVAQQLPDVRVDVNAISQVLVSLLHNASLWTPAEGKIHLKARAESKDHEPGYILIQITDTGEGIPLHELPRVFSRLYRTKPTQAADSGLEPNDLATVKALVEALGGRIWVDSVVGQGSTFSTLLPVMGQLVSE